jgi:hypothetical protein
VPPTAGKAVGGGLGMPEDGGLEGVPVENARWRRLCQCEGQLWDWYWFSCAAGERTRYCSTLLQNLLTCPPPKASKERAA